MSKKSDFPQQQKIGHLIAWLREQRRMTQGEFAKALKTSQSAVARMEKGEQNLSTEMLFRMGHVLHRSLIKLTGSTMNFRITGGKKLSGTITTNTAKNAALSILIASLLNKGKTTLEYMPRIEEVFRIIEVLQSIGVSIKWIGDKLEITPPRRIKLDKLNKKSAKRTRSVLMMIGPLVHHFKNFELPNAGGCKLGKRTVRPHLFALEKLGIKIKTTDTAYHVQASRLKKDQEIIMYEASVTATENIIMASTLVPGKTTIKIASSNYMVQDLCYFLEKLGIKIDGIGTSTLVIHGKTKIKKDISYPIMQDPIESMLFLSLAATTNSTITITQCPIDFLELELLHMSKMGFKYKILKRYKGRNGYTKLMDIKTLPSKLVAPQDSIHPLPYPGINPDNLPFFVPIATQAKGKTLIHDWIYEQRAIYYTDMNKLGAEITLADPHRVFIDGPTKLKASQIVSPPALRPTAIILIGMLAAEGTSILRNVYSINRGYEDLVTRLQSIGADIEIMESI
ncbi:MAG: UDP-N-acetylglucosamine 1-carboxyvinyltransferase [Parcubacteria group bacterium]